MLLQLLDGGLTRVDGDLERLILDVLLLNRDLLLLQCLVSRCQQRTVGLPRLGRGAVVIAKRLWTYGTAENRLHGFYVEVAGLVKLDIFIVPM